MLSALPRLTLLLCSDPTHQRPCDRAWLASLSVGTLENSSSVQISVVATLVSWEPGSPWSLWSLFICLLSLPQLTLDPRGPVSWTESVSFARKSHPVWHLNQTVVGCSIFCFLEMSSTPARDGHTAFPGFSNTSCF